MDKNEIGNNIRNFRKAAGLSQDKASSLLEMSRATYLRYETGEHLPSLENLLKISQLYNTSLYNLIAPLESNYISGQPSNQTPTTLNENTSYERNNFTNNAPQFLSIYNKLNENEKSYIIKMMNIFIDAHN